MSIVGERAPIFWGACAAISIGVLLHLPMLAMAHSMGNHLDGMPMGAPRPLDVQLTGEGNLYASITLPSLIVATHGGGTGLATQRECLELMGCSGPGTARKFAEIVAGVVLAGELSLGAAIMANEWVWSHERLGRNR